MKFCHFQPVHGASKNPITPKGILPIFEMFASARRCWGWAFGWKVLGAQVFYFCNRNVKTLRIDNIWNFATFNLYTVPEKVLYLQRNSTDFRNLCLSSKMFRVGICVKSFMCTGILLWQWPGENFTHQQHLKFSHFQPEHGASKNPISPRLFNRYSKSLPQLEDVGVGIWLERFRCAGFLPLQWQGENSALRHHLKSCHFQLVHCTSKNPISPKVLNRFSKSLAQLEYVEGGNLGGMFQVRRYVTFAMAMWKLCALATFEILQLSTCTLRQQKSYISKAAQPIFEVFASARRSWGWAFGW